MEAINENSIRTIPPRLVHRTPKRLGKKFGNLRSLKARTEWDFYLVRGKRARRQYVNARLYRKGGK